MLKPLAFSKKAFKLAPWSDSVVIVDDLLALLMCCYDLPTPSSSSRSTRPVAKSAIPKLFAGRPHFWWPRFFCAAFSACAISAKIYARQKSKLELRGLLYLQDIELLLPRRLPENRCLHNGSGW